MAITENGPVTTQDARELLGLGESSPRVTILREPRTYDARVEARRGGVVVRAVGENRSYFQDLFRSRDRLDGSPEAVEARERLAKHGREVEVERERERRDSPMLPPELVVEIEARAPTASYAAPPLWLNQYFATAPRPARVLADLAPNLPLPEGASSINLPRTSQGTSTGNQQPGAPVPSSDLVDAAVTSAVATIPGMWDVPIQLLDQSPAGAHLDWVAFTQMIEDFDASLEAKLINGTGVGTDLLGILSNTAIPTSNVITYTDATPTVQRMLQTSSSTDGGVIPQAVAAIGNNRKLGPEAWLMTTSRAAWFASGETNIPLALANRLEIGEYDLLAYPVKPDNAVPTNLGAGGNQDLIIACRPSDWLILQSEFTTMVTDEPGSGTLEVKLLLRAFVAALLRQPTSVAYVTGSGMITQSGF